MGKSYKNDEREKQDSRQVETKKRDQQRFNQQRTQKRQYPESA